MFIFFVYYLFRYLCLFIYVCRRMMFTWMNDKNDVNINKYNNDVNINKYKNYVYKKGGRWLLRWFPWPHPEGEILLRRRPCIQRPVCLHVVLISAHFLRKGNWMENTLLVYFWDNLFFYKETIARIVYRTSRQTAS